MPIVVGIVILLTAFTVSALYGSKHIRGDDTLHNSKTICQNMGGVWQQTPSKSDVNPGLCIIYSKPQ